MPQHFGDVDGKMHLRRSGRFRSDLGKSQAVAPEVCPGQLFVYGDSVEVGSSCSSDACADSPGFQDASAVKLRGGVTLATAATIRLAQPHLQPQLNSLQVVCLTSLSISGLGFASGQVWLSQIALFLPFIVAGWQLMTPDSSQSLAVRLWNEAKKQIPKMQKGEEIEMIAEVFSFR